MFGGGALTWKAPPRGRCHSMGGHSAAWALFALFFSFKIFVDVLSSCFSQRPVVLTHLGRNINIVRWLRNCRGVGGGILVGKQGEVTQSDRDGKVTQSDAK